MLSNSQISQTKSQDWLKLKSYPEAFCVDENVDEVAEFLLERSSTASVIKKQTKKKQQLIKNQFRLQEQNIGRWILFFNILLSIHNVPDSFPTRFTLSVLLLLASTNCEVQRGVCRFWQRWWGPCCDTISAGVEQALGRVLQGKLTYHLLHQLLSSQRDAGITAQVCVCWHKTAISDTKMLWICTY